MVHSPKPVEMEGAVPSDSEKIDCVLRAQAGIGCTCGLAVIVAILVREADGVVVASVVVVAFNLTHPVFFLALTFLTAVAGVPLVIELGETNNHHKRVG